MKENKVIDGLNHLLGEEIAAMVRYLHHSFIVFGPGRKPVSSFFLSQAEESMNHAKSLGEKIVALGGHPGLEVNLSWEPESHEVMAMLKADLEVEQRHLERLYEIIKLVEDDIPMRVMIESLILDEQGHIDELSKYIRTE